MYGHCQIGHEDTGSCGHVSGNFLYHQLFFTCSFDFLELCCHHLQSKNTFGGFNTHSSPISFIVPRYSSNPEYSKFVSDVHSYATQTLKLTILTNNSGHNQVISKNPFIETALTYALTYIWTLTPNQLISPASIRILADQAYYSNSGTPLSSSRFLDFGVSLKEAHKTGLGSSAALVTSFTAAVLSFYLPKDLFDVESERGLTILHNLAQASHSHAQGKVGSGFDIASAVFGSCLYKRFSPSLLSALPSPGQPHFGTALRDLVEGAWDTEIAKAAIKMPRGLRLVMCDVDCGSETPGMVKQVLKWREENKTEAEGIWQRLQGGNEALAAELTRLAEEGAEEPDGQGRYAKLSVIIQENRVAIRDMGEKSGVPIEPKQQTKLLDYCTGLDGVVGGVVPGAGGYDAIVLLVEDREDILDGLKQKLADFKPEAQEGDGPKIGRVGTVNVREEMVGVKREDLSLYKEWTT